MGVSLARTPVITRFARLDRHHFTASTGPVMYTSTVVSGPVGALDGLLADSHAIWAIFPRFRAFAAQPANSWAGPRPNLGSIVGFLRNFNGFHAFVLPVLTLALMLVHFLLICQKTFPPADFSLIFLEFLAKIRS